MPTQSSDIWKTDGTHAIDFGPNPNHIWIIDENVFIGSQSAVAVEATSAQIISTLINNGNIFSGSAAVQMLAASNFITNNAGHSIIGALTGIITSQNSTIANHGLVRGEQDYGVHFALSSTNGVLTNTGVVYGRDFGVFNESGSGNDTFNNSGLINSDNLGIEVFSGIGFVTEINNAPGGTIAGDAAAIHSTIGHILLDNRGTISGGISSAFGPSGHLILDNRGTITGIIDLNGTSQVDNIVNRGKIVGQTFLGSGNDVFTGVGMATSGKVFGEDGNDKLRGGSNNDQLDGGASNDVITGGRGRDLLTGGLDADRFDFNSITHSVKGSKRDKVLDFSHAQDDLIDLKTIDAKKGVSGNQTFKFIGKQDFHDKKGELRYEDKGSKVIVQGDVNGDGKADFEIWVGVGSLSKGDFVL